MKISDVNVDNVKPEDVKCDPCATFIPRPEQKLLGPGPVHIGIIEGDDGKGRYAKIYTTPDGHLGAVEL